MNPTPEQISEWRESGCNAFILDSGVSLGTCGAQAYVYGYLRARTEQATEIADLKAKLAEVMPLARFGDMAARKWANDAHNAVIYEDIDDELIEDIVGDVFLDEGIAPNIEATIEQLLKD